MKRNLLHHMHPDIQHIAGPACRNESLNFLLRIAQLEKEFMYGF